MAGKMFEFITKTWNPIAYCDHDCEYGWCKEYGFDPVPTIHESINHAPKSGTIGVCLRSDLFCQGIPSDFIRGVLNALSPPQKERIEFFMSKNPARYNEFQKFFNETLPSAVLGCTIESNRNYPKISRAPLQTERLYVMDILQITHIPKRFISIEPILDFDLDEFLEAIDDITPEFGVAIGYDNYNHHLPEPTLEKTMALIKGLEDAGIKVYRKTLRKAWNEPAFDETFTSERGGGIFDLFGARDSEGLAWLRSPYVNGSKVLLLHGPNTWKSFWGGLKNGL